MAKSGAAANILKARQEYEPLGQAVRTSPPIVDQQVNPSPIINDSLFPEWQCISRLAELPRHCSQAAEQEMWNEIDTSWEKKKGNPAKLTDARLPSMGMPNTVPDRTMTYALRSSAKKTGGEGGGSDGCKYDEEGRPECAVQSEKWIDSTVPGFVDTIIGSEDDWILPYHFFSSDKSFLTKMRYQNVPFQ